MNLTECTILELVLKANSLRKIATYMRDETYCLVVLIFLILPFFQIFGENILLKKGGIVKGKVIDQDDRKLKVQKEDGSTIILNKDQILKVVYKENVSAEEEEKIRKADELEARILKEKESIRKEKLETKPEIDKELIQQQEELSTSQEKNSELQKEDKSNSNLAENNSNSSLEDNNFSWKQFGKSLILPGWGHYSTQSRWKTYLYAGLFFASTYNAYTKYQEFTALGKEYSNPIPQYLILTSPSSNVGEGLIQQSLNFSYSNGQSKSLEKAESEANLGIGIASIVYLVSAIDAGFSKPRENTDSGWQIRSKHEAYGALEKNASVSAEYVWSF